MPLLSNPRFSAIAILSIIIIAAAIFISKAIFSTAKISDKAFLYIPKSGVGVIDSAKVDKNEPAFAIIFPEGWTRIEVKHAIERATAVSKSKQAGDQGYSVAGIVVSMISGMNDLEKASNLVKNEFLNQPGASLIADKKSVIGQHQTAKEYPARIIEYTAPPINKEQAQQIAKDFGPEKVMLHYQEIFVIFDNYLVWISGSAPEWLWADYGPIIKQSMTTFQFVSQDRGR